VDFSGFFSPGQDIKITSLLGTPAGQMLILRGVTAIMRMMVAGGDVCLNVDCKACGWGVVVHMPKILFLLEVKV